MEKRLQLWSPVWGWLATKEGESVDLKGQDLVLYETAIQEALEQEKLYYRKKSAPFNLMDYYDANDSVKEKVQNLDIQVKKEQEGLYVCASLALIEPLRQFFHTHSAGGYLWISRKKWCWQNNLASDNLRTARSYFRGLFPIWN